MGWISNPEIWVGLLTLTILEIVLGIDNIIFISILSGKLPQDQRAKARQIGLSLALIMRVLLLLSLGWVMSLTKPLAAFPGWYIGDSTVIPAIDVTGQMLILLIGGLFLIAKSVFEIHNKLEGHEHGGQVTKVVSFSSVIVQILLLDIVFSLDSVITAVGMVKQIGVMIAAVVIAMGVMLAFAGKISDFVEEHPTIKILALAFLILIGVNLVAESFHIEIPKGYTYFAMVFATVVEMINIKMRKGKPIHLYQSALPKDDLGTGPSQATQ
ncbi:TerC family protein [Kamptonema cortianum]|nr:TerC family protein [Geitlerinema splendidum]MDK3158848.1 TerC family protein [Kamptonema cortianum]